MKFWNGFVGVFNSEALGGMCAVGTVVIIIVVLIFFVVSEIVERGVIR